MNSDPASLDNLRDIVELPPVSWWPLAPGWWAVLFALTIFAIVAAASAWKRWNANAYRRAALRELESAVTLSAVEKILKRAALCAYPRAQIAPLSGQAWCQWLGRTSGANVPTGVVKSLAEEIFKKSDSQETSETLAFARRWIKSHKAPSEKKHRNWEIAFMLTFLHTWVIWLVPLPLLARWLVPPRAESTTAVRVPFLSRLQANDGKTSSDHSKRHGTLIIPSILWILTLLGLARPQWLESPIERNIPTRDLLCLVDLSGSMDHEDFTNAAGQPVNRLEAVKELLGDFLVKREGDRVGLVVFGTSPFLQVPFTNDLTLCQQLLQDTAVGMAGPRTALGDAIGLGIKLLEKSDAPQKTMITLTDGNDTASQVPPVEAARVARDNGITIHSIAIGDPTTVGEEQLDEDALRNVAKTANGDFFLALNREELAGIYRRLDEIETREVKTVSHRPRSDLFFWPIGAAILLSLVARTARLIKSRAAVQPRIASARLRVNARTFELETIE